MQESDGPAGDDLLLTSMAFFHPVLEPIFHALEPQSLCEIGIDQGQFTQHLLTFCRQTGCKYTGIDPCVDARQAAAHSIDASYIKQKSADALQELPPHSLYIIDGDHNHHTVSEEISLIFWSREHRPVLVFHDTAWPFARRDLYYDPDAIPADRRHAASCDTGPWPGKTGTDSDGFCAGEEDTHIAISEGGKGNGVLTAIEDAMADGTVPDGYSLLTIPVVFGCSILYPADTLPSAALALIQKLEKGTSQFSPLLERMESNRMNLYLTLTTSWEKFDALQNAYSELLERYEELMRKYGDLDDHSDRLLQAYKDLDAQKANLEEQLGQRR